MESVVCWSSESLNALQPLPSCCFSHLGQLMMNLIFLCWHPQNRKMELITYPSFSILLNAFDVARYLKDCCLKIGRTKGIVFLSFLRILFPKHVICLQGSDLYGFNKLLTIMKYCCLQLLNILNHPQFLQKLIILYNKGGSVL